MNFLGNNRKRSNKTANRRSTLGKRVGNKLKEEQRASATLTSSHLNINNSSYKAPNEMFLVALECRNLELSKHIWHCMVDTKSEGENLSRKFKVEHSINLEVLRLADLFLFQGG